MARATGRRKAPWAIILAVLCAGLLVCWGLELSQSPYPWFPPKTIVFPHYLGGRSGGTLLGYFDYKVTNIIVWRVGAWQGIAICPKYGLCNDVYPFVYAIPGVPTTKEVAVRTKLLYFEAVSSVRRLPDR